MAERPRPRGSLVGGEVLGCFVRDLWRVLTFEVLEIASEARAPGALAWLLLVEGGDKAARVLQLLVFGHVVWWWSWWLWLWLCCGLVRRRFLWRSCIFGEGAGGCYDHQSHVIFYAYSCK